VEAAGAAASVEAAGAAASVEAAGAAASVEAAGAAASVEAAGAAASVEAPVVAPVVLDSLPPLQAAREATRARLAPARARFLKVIIDYSSPFSPDEFVSARDFICQ